MPWPGDHVRMRDLSIGSQNMRVPTPRPVCTVCGCDCGDFRFEAFAWTSLSGQFKCPVKMVMIVTCMSHFAAPLAARLRAAEV